MRSDVASELPFFAGVQDKKRLVFEGTVGGDAASLSQLSEEDLRFLFQN